MRKDGISPSEEAYASIALSNHERDWSPSKGHRGLRARFLESQGLPKNKGVISEFVKKVNLRGELEGVTE